MQFGGWTPPPPLYFFLRGSNYVAHIIKSSCDLSNIYFADILPHLPKKTGIGTVLVSRYRPFHKTLPRSSAFVNWIPVRFYETGCSKIGWNLEFFTFATLFYSIPTLIICLHFLFLMTGSALNLALKLVLQYNELKNVKHGVLCDALVEVTATQNLWIGLTKLPNFNLPCALYSEIPMGGGWNPSYTTYIRQKKLT